MNEITNCTALSELECTNFSDYLRGLKKKIKVGMCEGAAAQGKMDVLSFLRSLDFPFECRRAQGALYYACQKHHFDIADWLIDSGAKKNHASILSCLIVEGNLDAVKYLLKKGADPDHPVDDKDIKIMKICHEKLRKIDRTTLRPVHFAMSRGSLPMVVSLVAKDCDCQAEAIQTIHAPDGYIRRRRYGPLQIAKLCGQYDLYKKINERDKNKRKKGKDCLVQ